MKKFKCDILSKFQRMWYDDKKGQLNSFRSFFNEFTTRRENEPEGAASAYLQG